MIRLFPLASWVKSIAKSLNHQITQSPNHALGQLPAML